MFEQYLPQTNKNIIVVKSKIFLHLNEALDNSLRHICQQLLRFTFSSTVRAPMTEIEVIWPVGPMVSVYWAKRRRPNYLDPTIAKDRRRILFHAAWVLPSTRWPLQSPNIYTVA